MKNTVRKKVINVMPQVTCRGQTYYVFKTMLCVSVKFKGVLSITVGNDLISKLKVSEDNSNRNYYCSVKLDCLISHLSELLTCSSKVNT